MPEETTTTTYVALLHHSDSIEGEMVRSATVRNPRKEAMDASKTVYAFYFFDIVRTFVKVDGQAVEMTSARLNYSKKYYIDAEELDYGTIDDLPGDHEIVLHYLECTDGKVLRCRTGNFVPYQPDQDVPLSSR
jgi:hypothetical protein